MEIIGNKIKQYRYEHGLTRAQLSEKINISGQQLAKYEDGINKICIGRLLLLANVLNKNINDMYSVIPKEFEVAFEEPNNQIHIRHTQETDISVSIVVSDIDHHHSIYAFDHFFTAKESHWIWTIPVPKHVLTNIDSSGFFRGYKVQVFTNDRNTFLEEHDVWV